MATTTIVGGSSVQFSLNAHEIGAAQQALAQLEQGFATGQVLTNPGLSASSTAFDVYNFSPKGGSFTLPGAAEAVVLTGKDAGSIRGHTGMEALIGNQGNDTINAAGGSGSIIVGDGENTIQLNDSGSAGGSVQVTTGTGDNAINLWGGAVTVSAVGGSSQASSSDSDQDNHGSSGDHDKKGHDKKDHDQSSNSGSSSAQHGNDTVNIFSGGNTVTSASDLSLNVQGGANQLNLSGNDTLTLGAGYSTVTLIGANAAILNLGGTNSFNLKGGGNDTFGGMGASVTQSGGGNYVLHLSGNDTITLGAGADTIIEAGAATVYGGTGPLHYTGGMGPSYIVAGSGEATLVGGLGADTFVGGAGESQMNGGGGSNVFIGGIGDDTMTASGASTNLFSFDESKMSGATDRVEGFHSGRDHIQLVGYDTAAALAGAKVVGGNTILSFDGGATKIELIGVKHLSASDFTH
jgi:Ca2+-binding RTX toxin-like protein